MENTWDWQAELAKAHLTQTSLGEFLGISRSQMSGLVKKMIQGEGKTATPLDEERWNKALEYIKFKQQQLQEA